MPESFAQVRMQPLYGLCHYILYTVQKAFFRGEIVGLENLPKDGGFLLASNHASHLDPPFVGAVLPHQLAFFARKSLWKPGIPAWWLDSVGAIPVERDSADLAAIKRVISTLRGGRPIVLFPEGTRSLDGELQPAKPGVGMIVCKTRVPVVPCRIFNSHVAFGRSGGLRPGTPIHIVYGKPLSPEDYDHPADGKERYQRASERIMSAIAALEEPKAQVL